MKRLVVAAALLVGAGIPLACTLAGGARATPLPESAVAALAEARALLRQRPADWRSRADEALARSAAAAPGWIGPERVRDDVRRQDLLGHVALAERRAALALSGSAADHYLVGRLEGPEGAAELERSARLDPSLAWGQHGLAWQRFQEGDLRGARRAGWRAVELARGSYELGTFATALARYAEDDRPEGELVRLARLLDDPRLIEPERTELSFALAWCELGVRADEAGARGFWRLIELVEHGRLSAAELARLGAGLLELELGSGVPDPLGVLLSVLPSSASPAEERLRALVLHERGAKVLARAAWERVDGELAPGAFQRARDLELGRADGALARWNAALPRRLCTPDGLPREPSLRALVLAARAAADPGGAVAFGRALLAAGWFEEAESWATFLAAGAPSEALELASKAAAGRALLAAIARLLERVDEGDSTFVPDVAGAPGGVRELTALDDLLGALEAHWVRFNARPLDVPLTASPRLTFGALASVVHPGPVFSVTDERAGRGRAGAEVPGLAFELARLGRFGIFGSVRGSRPDGAVLRRVGGEWKEGAHLGVPFAGWVAWCEGADVESRPGRQGSGVSGAALHEGYWIDLEVVRRDFERTNALAEQHLAGDGVELARALAERGPAVPPASGPGEAATWRAPLGEGERVLLAVLRERGASADGGTHLAFDEWLELTVLHEEGHLTDRTRFLPLLGKWPSVLGLILRHGLTPRAVARAVEYRAQLVALCVAPEPRFVLAECLMAAESEGGALAHGEAYRELVTDFLAELAALPAPAANLEPGRYLLYQLHCLNAADVRRAALALAQRHAMVTRGSR